MTVNGFVTTWTMQLTCDQSRVDVANSQFEGFGGRGGRFLKNNITLLSSCEKSLSLLSGDQRNESPPSIDQLLTVFSASLICPSMFALFYFVFSFHPDSIFRAKNKISSAQALGNTTFGLAWDTCFEFKELFGGAAG